MILTALVAPGAGAQTWVYAPMEAWSGTDPRAMGWPAAADAAPSPYDPVGLLDHAPRVAADLGFEQDYRDRNNDAYGTGARLLGLVRESRPSAAPFAAALQTDRSRWSYEALDKGVYDAGQRGAQEVASVAWSVVPGALVGVGAEHDDGDAAPLLAMALDIAEGVRIDARTLSRRMRFPLSYVDNDNSIDLALSSRRQVNEVGLRARVPAWGELAMRVDANEREHASLRWTVDTIPDYSVRYEYRREENPLASDINVNGESSGEIFGVFSQASYGLRITRHGATHDWHGGVKKTTVKLRLNGGVTDDDLIDLWAYLLPGERRFAARYAADVVQWFIGRELRSPETWTTRLGLQYISARANGNFGHWTPIPILGVGKLDEENKPLRDERSSALGISVGFTARIERWEISYGMVQLIPIGQSSSSEKGDTNDASVAARQTQGAQTRRADSRGFGGNVQRLQIVLNL